MRGLLIKASSAPRVSESGAAGNRLRMTADGNLKVCLFGNTEQNLRDRMREGMTDLQIAGVVQVCASSEPVRERCCSEQCCSEQCCSEQCCSEQC